MSLPNELTLIADKLNLYSGTILFITGSIGALLNIFTFSQPSLRTSSCSICLLAGSVFDLCHLITFIIWSLVNIPQLLYKGVVNNTCTTLSVDFALYLNYTHTPLSSMDYFLSYL